jgi:hypothetical protein
MKLIKFKTEEIDIPDRYDRPYFRTIEYEGIKPLSIYDENLTTMPLQDGKKVDYEMIVLQDGKKEWRYYVNFEEARLVMPILEGIVNNQVKDIRKINTELRVELAMATDEIKYYKKLWFIRLHEWILKRFK